MAKTPEPYIIHKRKDCNTYQFSLNLTCGLPDRICQEWKRKSFQALPSELAQYMHPKTNPATKAACYALIDLLKTKNAEGQAKKAKTSDITVGAWIEKFTVMETSPRTGINNAKNRSYSIATLSTYQCYWNAHIKDDPITKLKMNELEEDDILEFINRMSARKKEDGSTLAGTRTYVGIIVFFRMAFKNYQQSFPRWANPFVRLDPPKYDEGIRDFLSEDEIVKLFMPGVLKSTMEFAVCGTMFFAGLRRAEIAALRPEDLNWKDEKIKVKRAWQSFDKKCRILGPPKGKKA